MCKLMWRLFLFFVIVLGSFPYTARAVGGGMVMASWAGPNMQNGISWEKGDYQMTCIIYDRTQIFSYILGTLNISTKKATVTLDSHSNVGPLHVSKLSSATFYPYGSDTSANLSFTIVDPSPNVSSVFLNISYPNGYYTIKEKNGQSMTASGYGFCSFSPSE